MDNKQYRIEVFEDSQNLIKHNKDLIDSINNSIKMQQYINSKDNIDIMNNQQNTLNSKVIISKTRSLETARKYINRSKKVCVLNFASATTPGGGVTKGSSAQEECLCRVSTLYNCINDKSMWDKYYTPNRENLNALHTDDIIYTPNVKVFKDDDYEFISQSKWFDLDIITCAAPNLREKNCDIYNVDKPIDRVITDKELYDIHYKRAKRIFEVAIKNNVGYLVLGAFGCGAFKNNPYIVARAWKDITNQYKKYFNVIDYAIFCNQYNQENYIAFDKVFNK